MHLALEGKHTAIETGSWLDVLWDRKEVGFDQMSGMDVYNFLYMVSSVGETNSNTSCLREEVDDLMEVDEVADSSLRRRSWWSNGSGWSDKFIT